MIGVSFKPSNADVIRFNALLRPQADGCWIWLGYKNKGGYPRFRFNGRTDSAMHFALHLVRKTIPKGHEPDHLCRNRACVRPKHLEAVTKHINIMRGDWTSAKNARKTHCKRGHLFDKSNTMTTLEGWRQCKTCIHIKVQARRKLNLKKIRQQERASYYRHKEKRLEYAKKHRG